MANTLPKLLAVHPRVCREHIYTCVSLLVFDGSSPRVQGTLDFLRSIKVCSRFIPACAGNTPAVPAIVVVQSVHPRVCREHVGFGKLVIKHAGSSPRVQGTQFRFQFVKLLARFIPACAGNTIYRFRSGRPATVHPRVCREHKALTTPASFADGSSPRVQGTLMRIAPGKISGRFIPACAGNTTRNPGPNRMSPVHPRVCREHLQPGKQVGPVLGSSPRVQGTHREPLACPCSVRFIPACAGNTLRIQNINVLFSVHPRVCREHISETDEGAVYDGSSPRVQGTLSFSNWVNALAIG